MTSRIAAPPMTVSRQVSLFRRVVLATCAVLLAGPALAIVAVDGVAEAAPRPKSSSAVVAAAADEALVALDDWQRAGDPLLYVVYVGARDTTATLAADEIGLDAERLAAAWGSADQSKQTALLAALTQLGVPYRSMMSSEGVGFDCSGLTTYAWERAGLSLTRSSGDQIRQAAEVARADADPGDLVHYPGHIMMYLGIDNAVVHSPNSGNHVQITFVSDRMADRVVYADPTG